MRVLVLGATGFIGTRVVDELVLRHGAAVRATVRDYRNAVRLGRVPIDWVEASATDPLAMHAAAGACDAVVHCAHPFAAPSEAAALDLCRAAAAAAEATTTRRLVYISTTGVYGDCAGALVDETRPLHPQTGRAKRRADAERQLREWGSRTGVRVSILRAPGIYAADRLPLARLERGTPALTPEEDAYVNHVHADDLARMVVAALRHGHPNRSYNAVDDLPQRMGDYFDLVADRFGLPRPPRIAREEARHVMPPQLYSFMSESRRLVNCRIKRELRFALRYPSVHEGIAAARAQPSRKSPEAA